MDSHRLFLLANNVLYNISRMPYILRKALIFTYHVQRWYHIKEKLHCGPLKVSGNKYSEVRILSLFSNHFYCIEYICFFTIAVSPHCLKIEIKLLKYSNNVVLCHLKKFCFDVIGIIYEWTKLVTFVWKV